MKTILALPLVLLTSAPVFAEAPSFFSTATGNVGVYSEYVFRGITQSDENPALQGTLNFGQSTGVYAGAWGSNVDFNDGDEAHLELDLYGGYKWPLGPVTLDVGGVYYTYPGADSNLDYDYVEGKVGISGTLHTATLGLNIFVSPDYFAGSGTGVYANLYASAPIAGTGLSANVAINHQWIDDEAAFGVPDYADWNLGVSYAWEKFTFGLNYYDTNLSKAECTDGCEARVIGSMTRSF